MVLFAFGLIAGVALGVLVVGFLAINAYNRGFEEAQQGRKVWRAELVARQTVAARSFQPVRKAS
ncbi:MAG: hypothetical protein HY071_06025 [Chloroflexi bacterium]|nr:hypothetical protein [Chloroflexota bacterium]